jgi:hypothetical protein
MSRRNRRHGQQTSLAWPIIVFVGVLLIAAAFLLARRGGGVAEGSGTPQIAVDQQKIDYGYVPFGNNKQFAIRVSNTGDGVLRFKQKPYIEILEGC